MNNNICTCNTSPSVEAFKLTDINGIEYYAEYDSQLDEDTFRLEWNMGLDEYSIVEAYFEADEIAEGIARGFWVVEAVDRFDVEEAENKLDELDDEVQDLHIALMAKRAERDNLCSILIEKAGH